MRMAQEMAQVLIRAVSLKHQREYDQALRELATALKQAREGEPNPETELTLEAWIALCRRHEQAAPAVMLAIADLLAEQGDLLALKGRPTEGHRPRSLALGLYLDALLHEGAFVSTALIGKIEGLMEHTTIPDGEAGIQRRLIDYLMARGRLAKAEDVLFAWLEADSLEAGACGLKFYETLSAMSDADLEQGGLPRGELEQGRREVLRATQASPIA